MLFGWVHRRRDHGGLIFIDLRDATGLVQIAFDPERSGELHQTGHTLRPEDVLKIEGTVAARRLPTQPLELRIPYIELIDAEALADLPHCVNERRTLTRDR